MPSEPNLTGIIRRTRAHNLSCGVLAAGLQLRNEDNSLHPSDLTQARRRAELEGALSGPELPLRAVREVERQLRWLVVGQVGAPAVLIGR